MMATKTKEFLVEMKVLCKVHHASLVELIGYVSSKDELFLVYEYSQNGAKNHLHVPERNDTCGMAWQLQRVMSMLLVWNFLSYYLERRRLQELKECVQAQTLRNAHWHQFDLLT